MHSCIFNPKSTRSSDGLYYLILILPARPFLGLVEDAAPPPVKSCCVQHGWDSSLCCFYFYKVCAFTPWNFGNFIKDSALFLRVPFEGLISGIFGWGYKLSEEIDCAFRLIWTLGSVPNFSAISWACPLYLSYLCKRVWKILVGTVVVLIFSWIAQAHWLICMRSPSS